jgi:flagellar protein FliL
MADENIKEEEFKKPGKGSSNSNPLLTIVMLINLLFMGAIGFFQYQTHLKLSKQENITDVVRQQVKQEITEVKEAKNTGEARDQDGILFPLEGFTANLAQSDGPRRFLRLQAVLKFSKDSREEEFKARKPQIRDSIISILNSKRPDDLLKPEGKDYLKEEIKAAINAFLVDGSVNDVFYVGFQIN